MFASNSHLNDTVILGVLLTGEFVGFHYLMTLWMMGILFGILVSLSMSALGGSRSNMLADVGHLQQVVPLVGIPGSVSMSAELSV